MRAPSPERVAIAVARRAFFHKAGGVRIEIRVSSVIPHAVVRPYAEGLPPAMFPNPTTSYIDKREEKPEERER